MNIYAPHTQEYLILESLKTDQYTDIYSRVDLEDISYIIEIATDVFHKEIDVLKGQIIDLQLRIRDYESPEQA